MPAMPSHLHHIPALSLELAAAPRGADGLRWVHALASAPFEFGGRVHPLDDEAFFRIIYASLKEQIEGTDGGSYTFRPPYLVNHKSIGANNTPPTNLGQSEAVRLVTRDELVAQVGHVPGDAPLHIFLGQRLNALGKALDERDQLPHGSVKLQFVFDDKTRKGGRPRIWPAFLHEYSATPSPYIKELMSAQDTRVLQLSANSNNNEGETMTKEQLMAALANLSPEDRAEILASLSMADPSTQAGSTSANGVVPPVVKAKDDEPNASMPTLSASLELAELRAQLAATQKTQAQLESRLTRTDIIELCDRENVLVRNADGVIDERQVDDLVMLKLSDEDRFQRIFSRLPRDQRSASSRSASSAPAPEAQTLTLADNTLETRQLIADRAMALQQADASLTWQQAVERATRA